MKNSAVCISVAEQLAKFEPGGSHFFKTEACREIAEVGFLALLLNELSEIGSDSLYLQTFAFLLGTNCVVTPILLFSNNPRVNTLGVVVFDVVMDTLVGALLPMISVCWIVMVILPMFNFLLQFMVSSVPCPS